MIRILKDNIKSLEVLQNLYSARIVTDSLIQNLRSNYKHCPLCYYFRHTLNTNECQYCVYNLMSDEPRPLMCVHWMRARAKFTNFDILKGYPGLCRDYMGYGAKAALAIRLVYLQEQMDWCIDRLVFLKGPTHET